ncbi:MAG: prepilin-type N-terminal cleavage/methylation domain-containing protein [Gammaproteobacteria bacterium]|jgi:general secretion pathway protein J|nr:prepilin-type N-terminal cleavage/methylation domain-containing protein [Gammaproteobacteria bacterium]MBT5223300.1 prepilin-type N-terminal cleavage/methylation domain-containing protein [Gammaproteobacteria bacterium]MBT5827012.1 prepilin-type N-terminal cleavage/methylation domain-containing protein [Gammaproteobacteria bacterium]MBT6420018.1 prepilin-type N-terminal cleavage/methylation domain-containing protein [Gammaproteobacteria bacterium]MBT6575996.1 prepilin-type N-terminal cleavag
MKIVRQAKQPGFTLLEVLLGMSIMSVMMLLLFASLRICVQNWNAGEKKIAEVSQAAIIQNFLQSKLHATVPLDGDFLEEAQFSFQGSQDQIQFVAAMPASAGRLGLQLFKMNLQPSGRGEQGSYLQVEMQPFFPQGEGEEQGVEKPVIILRKIQRLQFAYFGSDNAAKNSDSSWQNDWLEKESLPKLVSIDIELVNGEVWPQLVVALKVDKAFGERGKPDPSFGIVNGTFVNID